MKKNNQTKFSPMSMTTGSITSILSVLCKAKIDELPNVLKNMRNEFVTEAPDEVLKRYVQQSGLKNAHVIAQAAVTKDYFYAIYQGKRKPSRDKAIQLCFGLQLSGKQANEFLKKMGHNELYLRDAIVYTHLENKRTFIDVEHFLDEHGYDCFLND